MLPRGSPGRSGKRCHRTAIVSDAYFSLTAEPAIYCQSRMADPGASRPRPDHAGQLPVRVRIID
jgi:hypothetical protein